MHPNRRIQLALVMSLALGFGFSTGFSWSGVSAQAADQRSMPLSGTTIADIAEKASPAVVHLEMRKKLSVNFQGMPPMGMTEFFLNGQRLQIPNFFGTQQDDDNDVPAPQAKPRNERSEMLSPKPDIASGFIVRPDGYILTNLHAVKGQDSIKVTLFDKRSYDATVVGQDEFSDLAVIKINARDLPTLPWGSSSALRPGEFAVAIGSPQGEDHTVSLGIISAVGRTEVDVNGNINFIQTDAAINPGNSGGPLLNLNGEVVGVNTAIRRFAQNIAYSIPADVARPVSDKLITSGSIDRPWLGITMSELEDTYIKGQGLPPETKGVLINNFVDGSPAVSSGLKRYDIIQKIDGKEMLVPKDVRDYVQSKKAGDVLNFIVLRDKKIEAVAVNVGTYPRKVNPR
jgi:S1-C subfamily serine protease